MKMNLLDTILIGTTLFGGIWTILILYIKYLVLPENTKKSSPHMQGAHSYSGILRKIQAYRQNFEKLAAESGAGIGAVYSQLQTIEAMDVRSRRVQRLSYEIVEESLELDDLLTALDEVYDKSY